MLYDITANGRNKQYLKTNNPLFHGMVFGLIPIGGGCSLKPNPQTKHLGVFFVNLPALKRLLLGAESLTTALRKSFFSSLASTEEALIAITTGVHDSRTRAPKVHCAAEPREEKRTQGSSCFQPKSSNRLLRDPYYYTRSLLWLNHCHFPNVFSLSSTLWRGLSSRELPLYIIFVCHEIGLTMYMVSKSDHLKAAFAEISCLQSCLIQLRIVIKKNESSRRFHCTAFDQNTFRSNVAHYFPGHV